MPARPQPEHAAHQREGHVEQGEHAPGAERVERVEQQDQRDEQRHRHHHQPAGPWPAPCSRTRRPTRWIIARRGGASCATWPARVVDERAQVPPAHVHADADVAPAVLAVDGRAAHARRHVRQRLQRHRDAALDGDAELADLLHVVARAPAAGAAPRRSARSPSQKSATGTAAHRGLEDVLEVAQRPCRSAPSASRSGVHLDLRHLAALDDAQVGDAGHLGDGVLRPSRPGPAAPSDRRRRASPRSARTGR